ncbi:glycoside hydrolase family 61 protein [Phlebiopsis gigantea 11061_1 CR5-6]|uniref:lytic cellulose monooxygenase (C4-dehydrogenating) n=1 Tax=Phlebiopsis gigantea (strain 11061_1 CR5-6) TaxID=745531 RepID=A0A0C3NG31_PHLG1|nr:glycoside hydrolase family 61 protein [Phlebiopsis gigantea 11061_1 CR5-6]
MKFSVAALSALAALVPHVAGHGFVTKVLIDGKEYDGNKPESSAIDSPVRMISTIDPVKGADNPSMTCGQDAQAAKLTVPANPGSNLQITWMSGSGDTTWVHNTGPIMNYMASCGSDDCSTFNGSDAKFFKIEQSGQDSDGVWAQAAIFQGQPFNLTLPKNLSPGGYILRHEIIALQNAQSAGGVEFYPSCIQLLVGGSGSGVPSPTVSFPGAYSDTDAGILVNVYNPGQVYQFPGGPLSNLASPGADSSDSTSPAASGSSGSSSSAASAATSSVAVAAASSPAASAATSSVAAPSASATKTCKAKTGSQKRMFKRHARVASH